MSLVIPIFVRGGEGAGVKKRKSPDFRSPEVDISAIERLIDLFTDTAAILNLLDLRSIVGCPGGTRSVLTGAFPAKIELHCIFLGKKAIVITSKQGTTIQGRSQEDTTTEANTRSVVRNQPYEIF